MEEYSYYTITEPVEAEVEVKRSRFICALKNVRTAEEAAAFIDSVRRQHRDARHNCFAYRIGVPGQVTERSGDDGEPQGTAGRPMLSVLTGEQLYDVCAVVTRYFGGILLGTGGLLRAYTDALKEGLKASGAEQIRSGTVLKLRAAYPQVGKISYAVSQAGAFVLEEVYSEQYEARVLVPEGQEGRLLARLSEIQNGAGQPRSEKVLYTAGERPQIYRYPGKESGQEAGTAGHTQEEQEK